jgi:hypothetical protein
LAYGLFEFAAESTRTIISAGGGLFMFFTLSCLIAVQFQSDRTTVNLRTVSGIFFVIALLSHLFFAFLFFSLPFYVITEGILLMIYLLIVYSVQKADA